MRTLPRKMGDLSNSRKPILLGAEMVFIRLIHAAIDLYEHMFFKIKCDNEIQCVVTKIRNFMRDDNIHNDNS